MQIINTVPKIQHYFSNAQFDISIWRKYACEISLQLISKCENDCAKYDFEMDVLPVLNLALGDKCKLSMVNDSFIFVNKLLTENMSNLFDKNIDLDIILYLGLCNGAGWATTLNNKNTILLGIEKIMELNWCDVDSMQGLVFHEIGHIWHKTYGNLYCDTISQKEKSIWQLYQEGVAMVCEQILCKNDTHFQQNKNGWLEWCQKNEGAIKREYLNRLNNSQSTQDFFGDWCSYQGHSDVGYYLGCQFIKSLQNKHSLVEIANLSCDVLLSEFQLFVKLV